jgi:hypothetical protein
VFAGAIATVTKTNPMAREKQVLRSMPNSYACHEPAHANP